MVGVEAGNRGAIDIYFVCIAHDLTELSPFVQEFIPVTLSSQLSGKENHVYCNCSAVETESRSTQEDCQEGDEGNNDGND